MTSQTNAKWQKSYDQGSANLSPFQLLCCLKIVTTLKNRCRVIKT